MKLSKSFFEYIVKLLYIPTLQPGIKITFVGNFCYIWEICWWFFNPNGTSHGDNLLLSAFIAVIMIATCLFLPWNSR
jgi:hypothetical protein